MQVFIKFGDEVEIWKFSASCLLMHTGNGYLFIYTNPSLFSSLEIHGYTLKTKYKNITISTISPSLLALGNLPKSLHFHFKISNFLFDFFFFFFFASNKKKKKNA